MRIIIYSIWLFAFYLVSGNISAQTEAIPTDTQKRFDYFFHEALNARTQGQYDSAFDYLNYCYALDSTNATVLYELGNYYNSMEDREKAFELYKRAVDQNPANYYMTTSYATLALELEKYTIAINEINNLVKYYPEKTNLYLYLAESYRMNKEPQKSIIALDKLENIIGMNEKLSLQKFQLYKSIKQEEKAFAEIQKYIDKYPTEIQYYVLLGDLYLQADKPDLAIVTYSKAKSIDPDNPYLISSISGYYDKVGDKEKAEQELKIALISPKMDVETKLAILAQYVTTLQMRKKDTKETNALFDTLMVQHPQEPTLNLMYGNLLQIQENKVGAREQYRIFAEANPSDPTGWEQMLFTAYPDSLDVSIEICKTALKHMPEQAQFHFFLGLSQYLKDDHEAALKTLLNGIQYVDPQNRGFLSDYHGQLGDLYYHTGKIDSAFVSYDASLKANPNNMGILNNYAYFMAKQNKDLDKAERMSGLTIKAEPLNPTYLDTYGWILFMQKEYLMARIYIERAIENTKKGEDVGSEVYEHYGDALYMNEKPEEALKYWIKAKEKGDSKSTTLDKKIEQKKFISEFKDDSKDKKKK